MAPTYLRFNYIAVNESTDWYTANLYCQFTFNTSLATITSDDENEAAIRAAKEAGIFDEFFIGLASFDNGTEWNWIDNTTTSLYRYAFSISTYQSHGCVEMDILTDAWSNVPCNSYISRFVCNDRTWLPTEAPTQLPIFNPTYPTLSPTPTDKPTNFPSTIQTKSPTPQPTGTTDIPTASPTYPDSLWPTNEPSNDPSRMPSASPIANPTLMPSDAPS